MDIAAALLQHAVAPAAAAPPAPAAAPPPAAAPLLPPGMLSVQINKRLHAIRVSDMDTWDAARKRFTAIVAGDERTQHRPLPMPV
eukprot:gene7083-19159_t